MPDGVRSRNLFHPSSTEPYALSRSKLELFLQCPRCFYLDRRLGIGRPDGPPFTLNNAVDALLKKEFDVHRLNGRAHPLMTQYGIDAVPLRDARIDEWREAFRGIRFLHAPTNFLFFGAVDDVWVDPFGNFLIVDYKATSTVKTITLDDPYRQAYKRQMEMYQWLFRKNGFPVSKTGYFVYVNADRDREAFDRKLEFTVQLLPYEGDDSWVDDALIAAHECVLSDLPPASTEGCAWCLYRKAAGRVES